MKEKSLATLELMKIAEENPGLPIIAKVYPDEIEDDGCVWCYGEVAGACVGDVLTVKVNGMCRIWTLNEALISKYVFVEENAPQPLKQKLKKLIGVDINDFIKAANKWIKSLPWEKCIIVYVDFPDSISLEPEI